MGKDVGAGILFMIVGFCLIMAVLSDEEAAPRNGFEIGAVLIVVGLLLLLSGIISTPSPQKTAPQADVQVHAASSAASETLAICPMCKARISAKSKFCPECGEDLMSKTGKQS